MVCPDPKASPVQTVHLVKLDLKVLPVHKDLPVKLDPRENPVFRVLLDLKDPSEPKAQEEERAKRVILENPDPLAKLAPLELPVKLDPPDHVVHLERTALPEELVPLALLDPLAFKDFLV